MTLARKWNFRVCQNLPESRGTIDTGSSIRYLDKLIDELARGKKMASILRQ